MPHIESEHWFDRFMASVQSSSFDWDEWVETAVAERPGIVRERLPDGRLPLRALLEVGDHPGIFSKFTAAGFQHDIVTATAAVDVDVVQRLLSERPDLVSEVDGQGNTLLHWACTSSYALLPCDRPGLVRCLLSAGADVSDTNAEGETPLEHIVRSPANGLWEIIDILLEAGAEPTAAVGVALEDYEFLDEMLAEQPHQIQWRAATTGESLLHVAVRYECGQEMVRYLMAHGAECVLESRLHGRTPLLHALFTRAYDEAEALVRVGADLTAEEVYEEGSPLRSRSVIELVVSKDRVRLAELIAERVPLLRNRAAGEDNLLFLVESREMAELLLANGFDPLQRTDSGRCPLDIAIEEAESEVVDAYLMQLGVAPSFFAQVVLGRIDKVREWIEADPTVVHARYRYFRLSAEERWAARREAEQGRSTDLFEWPAGSFEATALHYAAKTGSPAMTRLLLEKGADVNARDSAFGWTPLHDAVYYTIQKDLPHGEEVIRILDAAGADHEAESTGEQYQPDDIADHFGMFGALPRAADVFDLLAQLRRDRPAV